MAVGPSLPQTGASGRHGSGGLLGDRRLGFAGAILLGILATTAIAAGFGLVHYRGIFAAQTSQPGTVRNSSIRRMPTRARASANRTLSSTLNATSAHSSPSRPVGWRGDGSGLFPEADPPGAVRRAVAAHRPEVVGISVRNIDDQARENPQFLLAQVKPITAACRSSSSLTPLRSMRRCSAAPFSTW